MSKIAAKTVKAKKKSRVKAFLLRHWHALEASIHKLTKAPLATSLTVAVIGVALALPLCLFTLLQNIELVTDGFKSGTQISLYLHQSVDAQEAQEFYSELNQQKIFTQMQLITPAQGLASFEKTSGFGDAISQLDSNPLPTVIVLHPITSMQNPKNLELLIQKLKNLPDVEFVQLDMQWVKRLFAFLELGHRLVVALGTLFGFCVLLVVGNTIRLSVQNYKAEIEVVKLVGATDAYIRRPFLYSGIFYGLAGAVLAYLLMLILIFNLDTPIKQLADLYQSHFSLQPPGFISTLLLFITSGFLGWLGSWLTVSHQLHRIQPE